MTIPQFPEFREIDMSCKRDVDEFLAKSPIEASEYTFTNLFSYRSTYNFKLSILRNNLIILKDAEPVSAFCPVGNSHMQETLGDIFSYLSERNANPFLERVPGSFIEKHINDGSRFIAEPERDHFDYVYDVKELIELSGKRFHDKRNKTNKFRSAHEYEYIAITPDMIDECLEFEDYWCEVKDCEKFYGLDRERCAILQMLNNFELLDISGGAIKIDGRIAALSLGEKFLSDTIVIHVEKANPDTPGLYQVMNQEFLRHGSGGCQYVNREQDLGIEGLRKAKMSYNPVKYIEKYMVRTGN